MFLGESLFSHFLCHEFIHDLITFAIPPGSITPDYLSFVNLAHSQLKHEREEARPDLSVAESSLWSHHWNLQRLKNNLGSTQKEERKGQVPLMKKSPSPVEALDCEVQRI